jgi:uncharacterized membrane protein YsdA (DUF1294 family)
MQARRGGWRVSEFTLLLTSLLGGSPGAFFASRYFRHKRRKQSFMDRLRFIAMLQIVSVGYVLLKTIESALWQ